MFRLFLQAIKQLKEIKKSAPVGLLTCDHRDAWTIAREHLVVLDPKNRESLQLIEDALFCVTLDSIKEATKADRKTDFAEWAKFGMHGHGGHNRWCDKSMNLVLERDGKFFCHGEVKKKARTARTARTRASIPSLTLMQPFFVLQKQHSPCDALIPSLLMDTIIQKPTDLNAPSSNATVEAPKHLAFVTDAKALEHIKAAEVTIEKLSKNSDCGIIYFEEYGADYIKKVGRSFVLRDLRTVRCFFFYKLSKSFLCAHTLFFILLVFAVKTSPDAYLQMAIQLGYYKQIGQPCATYETGSTRQFRKGRTETTRTLSTESVAFCKAMENPSVKVCIPHIIPLHKQRVDLKKILFF